MQRNDEGGMVLTDAERSAVAYCLAAGQLDPDAIGCIEWDDVPELAESEWYRLQESLKVIRELLLEMAAATGVNHDELLWAVR